MQYTFTVYIESSDLRDDTPDRLQAEVCRHLYQVFGPMLKGVGHAGHK